MFERVSSSTYLSYHIWYYIPYMVKSAHRHTTFSNAVRSVEQGVSTVRIRANSRCSNQQVSQRETSRCVSRCPSLVKVHKEVCLSLQSVKFLVNSKFALQIAADNQDCCTKDSNNPCFHVFCHLFCHCQSSLCLPTCSHLAYDYDAT